MKAEILNRQIEATECGLACLAMAAHVLGSPVNLGQLRRKHPTSLMGTTLKDLIDIAGPIGLSARAVKCEVEELSDLKVPAILHWDLKHFVLLKRIKGNKVDIFDPISGSQVMSRECVAQHFTGIALELSAPGKFQPSKERPHRELRDLIPFDTNVRSLVAQAIVLTFLLQAYLIIGPLCTQFLVDQVIEGGDRGLVKAIALGLSFFVIFNSGAELLRGLVLQRLGSYLNWEMASRLFHHMIRLPLAWFQRRRFSDVLNRFQALEAIRNQISAGLVGGVIDSLFSIMLLMAMLFTESRLTTITVAMLAVFMCARALSMPSVLRTSASFIQAGIAEQSKRIETLRAIQTIKMMAAESQRESLWSNKLADLIRANQATAINSLAFACLFRALDGLGTLAITYVALVDVIDGELTVGTYFCFMLYRAQLVERVQRVVDLVVGWRQLEIYSHRLTDIISAKPEVGFGESSLQASEIRGSIELRDVAFRYSPSERRILSGIDLKIRSGECVAITGPSGAGKSTLLKLICGLYTPSEGEIYFDGEPILAWGIASLRGAIGCVMQDDELLPGSILENVSFFSEQTDAGEVWSCLRAAAIEREVKALPLQLDTFIGDMGAAISGGQKQRILLARALYKQPRILILDEATSHLDPARERAICLTLKRMNITRIMVAHRSETLALADRVILLNEHLRETTRQPYEVRNSGG